MSYCSSVLKPKWKVYLQIYCWIFWKEGVKVFNFVVKTWPYGIISFGVWYTLYNLVVGYNIGIQLFVEHRSMVGHNVDICTIVCGREVWWDCISHVSISGVTPSLVLHLSRTSTQPDLPHEPDIISSEFHMCCSSVIPKSFTCAVLLWYLRVLHVLFFCDT